MKTRLFPLWLLLLVAVGLSAYDFKVDGLCYNITNDTLTPYNVEVTYESENVRNGMVAYSNLPSSVIIPKSVIYNENSYNVTSIGGGAFYGCTGLTSVTIPNSVTSIRDLAFYCCTGLTSITIGNSVTYIEYGAFLDTPWYKKQSEGVVYINNVLYTYKGEMPENTSIAVREGTISVSPYAFSGRTGLTSITIPNSVTWIGDDAFSGCTGLTSITIPNSVTSIGEQTFYGCTGLTSITIPNSVTSIGGSAFGGEYSRMHKFVCMNPEVEFFGEMPRFSYALDTIIAPAIVFDVEESEWLTQPKYLKHAELTNGEMTDNVCHVLNRSYKTLLTLDLKGVSNTTIADEAFKGCYNDRKTKRYEPIYIEIIDHDPYPLYDVPCPLDQCMHHIEAQRAAREYDLAHSDELAAA